MTSIIIHDIDDPADLVCALAAVTEAFSHAEAYELESHTFTKKVANVELEAGTDAIEPLLTWPPGDPDLFLPCPDRGTHNRLTDCWMCWSDVMRGAALETDVLRTSWDAALALLAEDHQDDR